MASTTQYQIHQKTDPLDLLWGLLGSTMVSVALMGRMGSIQQLKSNLPESTTEAYLFLWHRCEHNLNAGSFAQSIKRKYIFWLFFQYYHFSYCNPVDNLQCQKNTFTSYLFFGPSSCAVKWATELALQCDVSEPSKRDKKLQDPSSRGTTKIHRAP